MSGPHVGSSGAGDARVARAPALAREMECRRGHLDTGVCHDVWALAIPIFVGFY